MTTNEMYSRHGWFGGLTAAILALLFLFTGVIPALAAPVSNVGLTKHNLSKTGTGSVKTSSSSTKQDQVCVFCHTPHAATAGVSPLWNKSVNLASAYTGYTSLSMDADAGAFKTNTNTGRPAGGSLLCLSCHDGTLALGTVGVLNAQTNVTISLDNTNAGKMPIVTGAVTDNTSTGFTRVIGQNLSNDHPISVTYNDALATDDGELRHMDASQVYSFVDGASNTVNVVGLRTRTMKPQYPLLNTGTSGAGQIQCPTCHDPHLYDAADLKRKFLRGNRLQAATPTGGNYNKDNDIICLACHDKMGTEWSNSIHAVSTVAYTDTAATLREFPTGTQVWKAACLNCHDTHTVSGARRLLREGTDDTSTPKKGGNSAIEETCYQCHTAVTAAPLNSQASALTLPTFNATGGVPNIKTEFLRAIRMPIKTGDQGGGGNTTEVHDISNADFIESDVKLGLAANGNRHAECTDCHNPHRVIKNSKYDGTGSATQRTHQAGGTAGVWGGDGNVASGVLRGMWGVEPSYGISTTWPDLPTSYTVKKGVPGATGADPLTKEYQLCLKCHSNFSNSTTAFPALRGAAYGGTPSGTNGVSVYTNVAAELAANATVGITGSDQGEYGNDATYNPTFPNGSPDGTSTKPNHRSWHPVMFPTGRTNTDRTGCTSSCTTNTNMFSNIRPPFNSPNNIGKQTMHCSDCHGDYGSWTQGTDRFDAANGPNLSKVQGPHGSDKNFLLKGVWDISIMIGDASAGNTGNAGGYTLCGRCHDPNNGKGGFANGDAAHSKSDHSSKARCMFCHIAVPHGWKNKAFLANLNCLGPEVGKPAGCSNAFNISSGEHTGQLWAAPYYNGSMLRIATWKSSNGWSETSCGPVGGGGSGWMSGTCQDSSTTQQAQTPVGTPNGTRTGPY